MHAGGVARGAAVLVYTHRHDTPDMLRRERVWMLGITAGVGSLLWDVDRARRSVARTLDDALAFAVELGDYAQRQYIVPQYHPERRHPSLLLHHWRVLAEVPLPTASGPVQLDLFAPKVETGPERGQRQIREALAQIDGRPKKVRAHPDDRFELNLPPYDVMALADIANRRRRDEMPERRDEVPA
jgi:hypothetical protein